MEHVARLPSESSSPLWVFNHELFVLLGDRSECKNLPVQALEYMADKVVFMKPLHDQHNAPGAFVVKTTEQRVVKPLVCSETKCADSASLGFTGSSMMM